MKNENARFVNVPISLMPELYKNCHGFCDKALDVGVYLYSKTLNEGDEIRKFKDAADYLGVIYNTPINEIIRKAREILSNTEGFPVVGIEMGMLFDYYKNPKKEFEVVCFGAFLGVKSIIGKKPYAKTNKEMIFARMFGFKSPKELPETLTPFQKKYHTRWQMDKILNELRLNWNLKKLWNNNRGIYVSFDLSLEQLAKIAVSDKAKLKLKQLAEEERNAIEKAKEMYNLN